ncbi:MAG: DsbA family protein [Candidatus Levyibacteriota bacterium]
MEEKSSAQTAPLKRTIPSHVKTFFGMLLLSVLAFVLGMETNNLISNKVEAQAAQKAQQAASAAQLGQIPTPEPTLGKQNVDVGNYPPKGDPNAKVTLIAFEDFRCPFCEKFFSGVLPQLQKDYIDTGKVKLYYRNYQFLGTASTLAGNAGECANEQNQFWAFHDYMYQNQPDEADTSMYTVDNLTQIAGNLGMDSSQFQQCLSSNKYASDANKDMADGQKVGVTATPTFFINGNPLIGAQPYSAFKTIIDQELKK